MPEGPILGPTRKHLGFFSIPFAGRSGIVSLLLFCCDCAVCPCPSEGIQTGGSQRTSSRVPRRQKGFGHEIRPPRPFRREGRESRFARMGSLAVHSRARVRKPFVGHESTNELSGQPLRNLRGWVVDSFSHAWFGRRRRLVHWHVR
jgi:hypothetical protein